MNHAPGGKIILQEWEVLRTRSTRLDIANMQMTLRKSKRVPANMLLTCNSRCQNPQECVTKNDPPHAEYSHPVQWRNSTRRDLRVHYLACVWKHREANKDFYNNIWNDQKQNKGEVLSGVCFLQPELSNNNITIILMRSWDIIYIKEYSKV